MNEEFDIAVDTTVEGFEVRLIDEWEAYLHRIDLQAIVFGSMIKVGKMNLR